MSFFTKIRDGFLLLWLGACLLGISCRSEAVQEQAYPQEFILNYYLELQDGTNTEVYQGTSFSENVSRFSNYSQDGLTIINFHIPGNESPYLNGITGLLLFDKKQDLYPFGKNVTTNELCTSLTLVTDTKFVKSQYTGSQALSNIRYFHRTAQSDQGAVAFRYEFKNVAVKDQITKR